MVGGPYAVASIGTTILAVLYWVGPFWRTWNFFPTFRPKAGWRQEQITMNERDFHGFNLGYVLELYARYRRDPASVDPESRSFFEHWVPSDEARPTAEGGEEDNRKMVCVVLLADAIRKYGHRAARLDPLGTTPPGDPALELETYSLSEETLKRFSPSLIGGPIAKRCEDAGEAIEALGRVYTSTRGYDYGHIHDPHERQWLTATAESGHYRPPEDPIDPKVLLDRLCQIDAFETFLHRTFPGKFRFSIQGLDMLLPLLDELIGEAAESGIRHILIGMPHRGRLNVLSHILNKPYAQVLAEFKDPVRARTFRDELGWTGDVKYHMGARRSLDGGRPVELAITMPPNPSHVEAVNPIVEGMARAAGTGVDTSGAPRFEHGKTLPILVHGDAAFPGQGVVAETLNLSRLPGYHTGGTIHIIANNQLGYTTERNEAYSTLYASDLAKGFEVPIIHVNADDPEACIEAARIAFAYLSRFHKDFLIDLVGYRRYGHNESDEPRFTQPTMYRKIDEHPSVRELWAEALHKRGIIEGDDAQRLFQGYMDLLQDQMDALEPEQDLTEPRVEPPPPGAARRAETAVPLDRLQELNRGLLEIPEGFELHPKIERAREKRRSVLEEPDETTVDWATAEELALASILADGIAIRMTGEDTERGTFSQRHAVFHHHQTGVEFCPLQSFRQARAAFEIHNSPLTENAALGFEFGYNVQTPNRLVIWEAQYGDFVNGAQVVVDEFLVSARAKWGLTPSLVLLLPHGYEGHGPDHSSAYLERFLQLAAEGNVRIANCTTAAQFFHLLRRQAVLLDSDPLPLVVMTPKALLRHPLSASTPRELAEGRFHPILDDRERSSDRRRSKSVRRLLFCSGKVYTDLVGSEEREGREKEVALCRVEQLYPFPVEALTTVLEGYPRLEEVTWVQEEPENRGAWTYVRPLLGALLRGSYRFRYVGRPALASAAEGSAARHKANQEHLVRQAYRTEPEEETRDVLIQEVPTGKES